MTPSEFEERRAEHEEELTKLLRDFGVDPLEIAKMDMGEMLWRVLSEFGIAVDGD